MTFRFLSSLLALLGIPFLGALEAQAQNAFFANSSPSPSPISVRARSAPLPSRTTPATFVAASSLPTPKLVYASPPAFSRNSLNVIPMPAPALFSSPGVISRMEGAFRNLDTPFISEVHLPLVAFWRGHIQLDGFESDLPTDYFLWGLPGAGTVQGLSWSGGGHLAVMVPAAEDSYGFHLTLRFHTDGTDAGDSSGLHGLQRLARAGRHLLHL